MKKLIIVATVAMAAIASNAASLNWSIGPNAWNADKPASGAKYWAVVSTALTETDVAAAIASKDQAKITTAMNGLVTANKASTGTFATAYGNAQGAIENDAWATGTPMDVMIVAFDDADPEKFLVSNAASGQTYDALHTSDKKIAQWAATATGLRVEGTWTSFGSGTDAKSVQVPVTFGPTPAFADHTACLRSDVAVAA